MLSRGKSAIFFTTSASLGNRATHENEGNHAEALTRAQDRPAARASGSIEPSARKRSRRCFRSAARSSRGNPGPHEELARLRAELDEQRTAAEKARASQTENEAREAMSAEERARKEREERAVWEQLAAEAEHAKAALATQLQTLQAAAAQAPAQARRPQIAAKAEAAAAEIDIDEASTRALIDEQLRARGWEVDTQTIRYGTGTRPAKGRNMAIAEWPTKSGPADYALFVGTRCIGVVEAKRRNKNVSSHIDQAQRYARGLPLRGRRRSHR